VGIGALDRRDDQAMVAFRPPDRAASVSMRCATVAVT
jgi:hypothetical protein